MNKIFEYALLLLVAVILLWFYPMWILSAYQSGLRKDCNAMGQSRQGDFTVKCEVLKKDAP